MSAHPTDRAELERRVRAGWRPKFVYLWSHEPARSGALGSECFSQWYHAPFVLDGVTFPTAEHAMMWKKAMLFGDDEAAATILAAKSPAAAKRFGRGVRGFTDAKWDAHRMDIVRRASVAKFGQNPLLRPYLVGTSAFSPRTNARAIRCSGAARTSLGSR